MKNILLNSKISSILIFALSLVFLSCSSDSDDEFVNEINISNSDKDALLFMFEEEKLARDTYDFLDSYWQINQFANIKISEQNHMDAVESLLLINNIEYNILPYGEFKNTEIQSFYDEFIAYGKINELNAMKVGATIEDLDIVDLQERIDTTDNEDIINVFESLKCGSENHLRSFVKGIVNLGGTYEPQFLTENEYLTIINSSSRGCN